MTAKCFTPQEFEQRLARTRQAMQKADLDVLFVENPANMAWLTGYDGWSFYVHQGVVVFHDRPPLWWGRRQDANGAKRTVYMDDAHIVSYAESYIQRTDCHPMEDLAKHLLDLGYGQKRIGVEMDSYYFSAKAYTVLCKELPQAQLIDATSLVNWQRGIKSAAELALMAKAAKISEKMITLLVDRIEVGGKKNELVAEVFREAIIGTDDIWGDYPAIVPLLACGADASASHLTWNGDVFRAEEGSFLEISGCHHRYHAPQSRTVYLGTPPKHILNAEAALIEGLEAGIMAAKPGNTAGDIARALSSVLKKFGIEREARAGYGVGIAYPPDWGEHTVSIRVDDDTVLQPNMTFHFMPGLWMDDWGLEMTETIVIASDGPARCLCQVPRKLFIKPC